MNRHHHAPAWFPRGGAAPAGDTTAPAVDSFTVTTPTTSLDVEITAFTASDAVGVTGYLITESSTPPASNDAGWEGTAPTTYAADAEGTITLYPWAKDAAGNVSSVFGSPREVEVVVEVNQWWLGATESIPASAYVGGGAWCATGAASAAAALVNLTDPGTHNLSVPSGGTSPDWSPLSGWWYDGTETVRRALSTGIDPTQTTTILVRYENVVYFANLSYLFGSGGNYSTEPTLAAMITLFGPGLASIFYNGPTAEGSERGGATPQSAGILGVCGAYGFVDTTKTSAIPNSTAYTWAYPIYLGNQNNKGTVSSNVFRGSIIAAVQVPSVLSDDQYLDLVSAMMALPYEDDEIFDHTGDPSDIYVSGV